MRNQRNDSRTDSSNRHRVAIAALAATLVVSVGLALTGGPAVAEIPDEPLEGGTLGPDLPIEPIPRVRRGGAVLWPAAPASVRHGVRLPETEGKALPTEGMEPVEILVSGTDAGEKGMAALREGNAQKDVKFPGILKISPLVPFGEVAEAADALRGLGVEKVVLTSS